MTLCHFSKKYYPIVIEPNLRLCRFFNILLWKPLCLEKSDTQSFFAKILSHSNWTKSETQSFSDHFIYCLNIGTLLDSVVLRWFSILSSDILTLQRHSRFEMNFIFSLNIGRLSEILNLHLRWHACMDRRMVPIQILLISIQKMVDQNNGPTFLWWGGCTNAVAWDRRALSPAVQLT